MRTNLILGAGVAGLWLHKKLNDAGIPTLLIDTKHLGSGQSLSAQGIIHGGIKYSLSGKLSSSADAIADMPKIWRDCLAGKGVHDLSDVSVLAENQLMWSESNIAAKLTGFFSSKAVRGKISILKYDQYPKLFRQPEFSGNLYQLNEQVLDTYSLLCSLSKRWHHRILQLSEYQLKCSTDQSAHEITLPCGRTLLIDQLILTAGESNQNLLEQLGRESPKMQLRPLHMLLLKSPTLPNLFAHCIGASNKPLLTISSHKHSDGDTVWYLGGKIAEEGVNTEANSLIEQASTLLKRVLPWADISKGDWRTHRINRAEPKQSGLIRPDTAFVESSGNIHTAWPVKLALTPVLSNKVLAKIKSNEGFSNATYSQESIDKLSIDYPATVAAPLWERLF